VKKKKEDYETLRKKWYKKLKDSGFNDIESYEYPDGYLNARNFNNVADYENKVEYFRFASQFLHEYKFCNPHDEKIWKMHSEGSRYREIAKAMNLHVSQTFYAIRKIKKKFREFITNIDKDLIKEKELSMKFNIDEN